MGRIALLAPTAADVRDVMVEGDSGILAVAPNHDRPKYEPSKRRITWDNGSFATTFSADEPDRLRGPQFGALWVEELCAMRYAQYAWDMSQMGLRLGDNPQSFISTTPRPIETLRMIIKDPSTVMTRATTYDNRANLPGAFFKRIVARYEGTRLGRQELLAELLDDIPGALWQRDQIDADRVSEAPELTRITVGIDPAVSSNLKGKNKSNEHGIVAGGKARNGHYYILDDATLRGTPDQWAKQAVATLSKLRGDRIVAEVNQGGDMVEHTLKTLRAPGEEAPYKYRAVRATRGKVVRAEPIAALYEQHKVHHVGSFAALEDQMCMFTSDGEFLTSPDRVDALVWMMTDLMQSGSNIDFGSISMDSEALHQEGWAL